MVSAQPQHITLLHGKIQQYDWGKVGSKSIVANLYSHAQHIDIDNNKPYAELWLGTHDSGHTTCPHYNHNKLSDHINTDLPYLFKILSINKALSIQAHPDKKLAEILHKNDPKNYKDDNHKPEMAIGMLSRTILYILFVLYN